MPSHGLCRVPERMPGHHSARTRLRSPAWRIALVTQAPTPPRSKDRGLQHAALGGLTHHPGLHNHLDGGPVVGLAAEHHLLPEDSLLVGRVLALDAVPCGQGGGGWRDGERERTREEALQLLSVMKAKWNLQVQRPRLQIPGAGTPREGPLFAGIAGGFWMAVGDRLPDWTGRNLARSVGGERETGSATETSTGTRAHSRGIRELPRPKAAAPARAAGPERERPSPLPQATPPSSRRLQVAGRSPLTGHKPQPEATAASGNVPRWESLQACAGSKIGDDDPALSPTPRLPPPQPPTSSRPA